jgi:nitrate/nitrite transporter NarK
MVTGIVGAAGGVGGFFLPNLLGTLKRLTGSFGPGFLAFALFSVVCITVLCRLRPRWERILPALAGGTVPDLARRAIDPSQRALAPAHETAPSR